MLKSLLAVKSFCVDNQKENYDPDPSSEIKSIFLIGDN